LSAFIDTLKSIDSSILLAINGWHSPFWDNFMMYTSNRLVWIPLYLGLVYVLYRKFGKSFWLIVLFAIAAVAMSDQLASHLVKNLVMRYRPSHNLILAPKLHFVDNYMGGLYGFASSHASNTFAIAVFLFLLFPKDKLLTIAMFFWACLVCYSRMYLGVHYPSDIVGGMIIGSLSAWLCYTLWHKLSARLQLK
jgi:undecaprenyl-diphosphatase